jgi:hypothetical protein
VKALQVPLAAWLLAVLGLAACHRGGPPTRVAFVASIHDNHRSFPGFGFGVLEQILRATEPDVVLAEIPPERFGLAWSDYERVDSVEEVYVQRFPEMSKVVFPLKEELGYELHPVSGWSYEVMQEEQGVFKRISGDPARREDWTAFRMANERMVVAMDAQGGQNNPVFMHSADYDSVLSDWGRTYDSLFADELGAASWQAQNQAHWQLIEARLDSLQGQGKSVAIVFSAGNRNYLLRQLRLRKDVKVVDMNDLVRKLVEKNPQSGN